MLEVAAMTEAVVAAAAMAGQQRWRGRSRTMITIMATMLMILMIWQ
jgi:hypothetical protein